jgi:hypothetical protein
MIGLLMPRRLCPVRTADLATDVFLNDGVLVIVRSFGVILSAVPRRSASPFVSMSRINQDSRSISEKRARSGVQYHKIHQSVKEKFPQFRTVAFYHSVERFHDWSSETTLSNYFNFSRQCILKRIAISLIN